MARRTPIPARLRAAGARTSGRGRGRAATPVGRRWTGRRGHRPTGRRGWRGRRGHRPPGRRGWPGRRGDRAIGRREWRRRGWCRRRRPRGWTGCWRLSPLGAAVRPVGRETRLLGGLGLGRSPGRRADARATSVSWACFPGPPARSGALGDARARRGFGLIAGPARRRRCRGRHRDAVGVRRDRLDRIGRGARRDRAMFPTLVFDRRNNGDRGWAGRHLARCWRFHCDGRARRSGDLENRHRHLRRCVGGAVCHDAMPPRTEMRITGHGEADRGRPVGIGRGRLPQYGPRLTEQAHLNRRGPRKSGRRHGDDGPGGADGRIELQRRRHLCTSAAVRIGPRFGVMATE